MRTRQPSAIAGATEAVRSRNSDDESYEPTNEQQTWIMETHM